MANPIVKINGERIQRSAIESWTPPQGDTNEITVGLVSGRKITITSETASSAAAKLGVLDNLTIMDDIDGL